MAVCPEYSGNGFLRDVHTDQTGPDASHLSRRRSSVLFRSVLNLYNSLNLNCYDLALEKIGTSHKKVGVQFGTFYTVFDTTDVYENKVRTAGNKLYYFNILLLSALSEIRLLTT